jgi:hypothetical protein
MIDRERLERLREASAEICDDLERREADPYLQHEILMAEGRASIERALTTVRPASLVFKTVENAKVSSCDADAMIGDDDEPVFTDAQLDTLAIGLAEFRAEMHDEIAAAVAPLIERIVRLEGQVTTLLQIIAGDADGRTLELPQRLKLAKPA